MSSDFTLTYVDYEFSGLHPALLDIAVPYYIDCFYNIYYELKEHCGVTYKIDGCQIIVDYNHQLDPYERQSLIHMETLLQKMFVAGIIESGWREQLKYACICYSMLTKKYSIGMLIANFSTSIQMSDVFISNLIGN